MVDVVFKRNGKERKRLEFKDACAYLDHIMEITPIHLQPNDELVITWNVEARLLVNDEVHDKKMIRHKTTIEIKEPMKCRFVRLVKAKSKRRIYIYEKLPKELKERFEKEASL